MVIAFAVLPNKVLSAEIQFQLDSFKIEGLNPLSENQTNKILSPFTGEHSGIERLREAADALEAELNRTGHRFNLVALPPQELDSGTITLQIVPLVIGNIKTSGNKRFSDENVLRSLPQLVSGETPNTRSLSRALAVANFNTAKKTRLTFSRGKAENTIDATIQVRDRPPQQVYTWLNNTGSKETTRTRLGLGYQHRNLFDRDHNLTATYTTSPEDVDKVQQYGFNYQIPLYSLTATLGLFHVNSDIDSGRVADTFDVQGGGKTSGIRYSQILNKIGEYRQRAYIEVTDKLFDNNVDFFGNEIGIDVRSRPISATWQLEWEKLRSDGRINISYARNLSGGSFNNQDSYAQSRAGASEDWDAFRLNVSQNINLPRKWRASLGFQGQYANEPLISGEQFGLGGAFGPRGFEEREVGVDRGANVKIELWAPPSKGNLQFGVFADYGYGDRIDAQAGEASDRDISSIGINGKWQWHNRLITTFSYGYVLNGLDQEPDLTQDGDSRVHFNILYKLSRD